MTDQIDTSKEAVEIVCRHVMSLEITQHEICALLRALLAERDAEKERAGDWHRIADERSAEIIRLRAQLSAANDKLASALAELDTAIGRDLRLIEHCRQFWRGQVVPHAGRSENCLEAFNAKESQS